MAGGHGIISTDIMPAPSEASAHRKAYHIDRHDVIFKMYYLKSNE